MIQNYASDGVCDGFYTFYSEKLVTARKMYRCLETRRPILVGDKYWRVFGVFDGVVLDHKISCGAMDLLRHTKCNFGELRDFVKEHSEDTDLTRRFNDVCDI